MGVLARWRRRLLPPEPVAVPWAGEPQRIVHFAHHKVGTVWFGRVLETVAGHYGLGFRRDNQPADVALYWREFDHDRYGPFRGSHMVRDPRDVVVSGYYYHLHTSEFWAHEPSDEYGGRTYQEHLNSLNVEEGLLAEIRMGTRWALADMGAWVPRPEIIELRYEETLGRERETFERVFLHYGFTPKAARQAAKLADGLSFKNVTGREVGEVDPTAHLRSGKPGQWREVFGPEHVALLEEKHPGLVERLGYCWS